MGNIFYKIFKIKNKIVLLFKFLFSADWVWRAPPQCDVLVFDKVRSDEVKLLFETRCKIDVLPIRGESLNIPVLLILLLGGWPKRKNILFMYTISYIKKAKPKLVITFIDNSPLLYSISNEVAGVKTAFIQNGQRGIIGDIFETLTPDPSYFVDFMFVHGINIGRRYSQFVEGEIIPIGSIKNNIVADISRPTLKEKNRLVFISQWRPNPPSDFFVCTKDHNITHEDFYAAESVVLGFLSEWCHSNGYDFSIIGCAKGAVNIGLERQFYNSIVKTQFTLLTPSGIFDSYHQLNHFDIVTFIDSTLGYESLARRKKTAAFTIRGSMLNVSGWNFGWPGHYEDIGPFWTNMTDQSEFKKIMDYLRDISEQQWSDMCLSKMKDIMSFDPNNTIIKDRLAQILE